MSAISSHRAADSGVRMSELAAKQPEHPAIPFAGRERACSYCLPGSNKEVPVRKGALAGIVLDECKGSQVTTFSKKHSCSNACVYSFVT